MTSLLERTRKPGGGAVVIPPLPQVNLLPANISDKRALGRLKRMLGYGLLAVVIVMGGVYFLANQQLSSQQDRLSDAQDKSTELLKQQAQYQEAPKVLAQVTLLSGAQALGFSTDVTWSGYLNAVAAVLPDGVQISTLSMNVATPMVLPADPTNPLQQPSIGSLTFQAKSKDMITTAGWADALDKVPGFGDAWVSNVTVGEDPTSKDAYYTVQATVQVRDTALSGRFALDKGE
ncbi:PilN domain-containing protein [Cellulomonas sp. HZM]|uniref:PilN domain-containing protein n=1 Tax=Cellulomonas sp. HZM TaxID=1454010 RepID=UPI000492FD37|nr:hypothetical protein [Cellulomonas sp. HZM]